MQFIVLARTFTIGYAFFSTREISWHTEKKKQENLKSSVSTKPIQTKFCTYIFYHFRQLEHFIDENIIGPNLASIKDTLTKKYHLSLFIGSVMIRDNYLPSRRNFLKTMLPTEKKVASADSQSYETNSTNLTKIFIFFKINKQNVIVRNHRSNSLYNICPLMIQI